MYFKQMSSYPLMNPYSNRYFQKVTFSHMIVPFVYKTLTKGQTMCIPYLVFRHSCGLKNKNYIKRKLKNKNPKVKHCKCMQKVHVTIVDKQ